MSQSRFCHFYHVSIAACLNLVHVIALDAGVEHFIDGVEERANLKWRARRCDFREADDVREVNCDWLEELGWNLRVVQSWLITRLFRWTSATHPSRLLQSNGDARGKHLKEDCVALLLFQLQFLGFRNEIHRVELESRNEEKKSSCHHQSSDVWGTWMVATTLRTRIIIIGDTIRTVTRMAMPIASLSLASVDSVCTSFLSRWHWFELKRTQMSLMFVLNNRSALLDAPPQARMQISQALYVGGHWSIIIDCIEDARVDSPVKHNCLAPSSGKR